MIFLFGKVDNGKCLKSIAETSTNDYVKVTPLAPELKAQDSPRFLEAA